MSVYLNRARQGFLLVIVVMSWVLFYNCFYEPMQAETSRVAASNVNLKEQLEKAQNRTANREESREMTERLINLHQENVLQVPSDPGEGEFLMYVAQKAEANGVRLAAVQEAVSTPSAGEPFPSYQFSLCLEGYYDNLWSLLWELETGKRLVSIKKVKLCWKDQANLGKSVFMLGPGEREAVFAGKGDEREKPGDRDLDEINSGVLVCECTVVVYFDPGSPKLE